MQVDTPEPVDTGITVVDEMKKGAIEAAEGTHPTGDSAATPSNGDALASVDGGNGY